jgi:hypothetical protein
VPDYAIRALLDCRLDPVPRVTSDIVQDKPDPRIAHAEVVSGAPDLVGDTLVIVDVVMLDGDVAHIPRPLAGVPELVAVAEAEKKAELLRQRLVSTLVDQGLAKWQPDTTLVVEMKSAAEAAVTSAIVGLEAFSSHHVAGHTDETGHLSWRGEQLTPQDLRERLSLDQRYKLLLPELMSRPKPSGQQWWAVLRRIQGLAALTRHAIYEPVKRSGLTGTRTLAERFYRGEFVGVTGMLFECFEHFSPNWIPEELRNIDS